jgi:hypothetical protein
MSATVGSIAGDVVVIHWRFAVVRPAENVRAARLSPARGLATSPLSAPRGDQVNAKGATRSTYGPRPNQHAPGGPMNTCVADRMVIDEVQRTFTRANTGEIRTSRAGWRIARARVARRPSARRRGRPGCGRCRRQPHRRWAGRCGCARRPRVVGDDPPDVGARLAMAFATPALASRSFG